MNLSARTTHLLAGLLSLCLPLAGLAADNLSDWFSEGDTAFSFRWRLEHVDDAALTRDATAIPLRARITFTTGDWQGFSWLAEYDQVADFGLDHYNEGGGNTPDRSAFPVIADPSGGAFNQAWVQYRSEHGSQLRAGRQRIIYDNARFVGNVGWRQNEQTYDGATFERKVRGNIELRVAWIDQVNRIFGDDVATGTHQHNTWLLNVSHAPTESAKLTLYKYGIDDQDDPFSSNRTWGLRWSGKRPADSVPLTYTLEYAIQQNHANNPVNYTANYWRADLAADFSLMTVYVGIESLGGDRTAAGKAFSTPLATLHAFNGWADRFLATPQAGLLDAFGGVRGQWGAWEWNVLFHDFSAQSGPGSYGQEIDASLSRKLAQRFDVLFKAARFTGEQPAFPDVTKLWVQLSANF